jgi:predicted GNAT family acetyltransferase
MLKLEFNPSIIQLFEIKAWLKKEQDETDEGFYCSWYMVERFFDEEQLIIGLFENSPIAFMTYNLNGTVLIFDLMEVKPSHRKKGLGKIFVLESIEYFKSKKIKKVEVDSIYEGSREFCRKLGFVIDNDPTVSTSTNYKLIISQ